MKISQKTIMKKEIKDIFSKIMFNILKSYMTFSIILFSLERMKIEKFQKLLANWHNKTETDIHI